MQPALTLLIKTFLRPASCLRLLHSVRRLYPSLPVLIADDSDTDDLTALRLEEFGPTRLLKLPFDSGVSYGRNRLVEAADTPLVMLVDDDFIFTPATKIDLAVDLLHKNPDLDLVAGSFEDGYLMHGQLEQAGDVLTLRKGVSSGGSTSGLPLYDLVHNLFVARRAALARLRWDEELKICEHIEFFLRAKRANALRCTYAPTMLEVRHERDDSPPRYATYRFERVRHFGALSWSKMGLRERVLVSEDGRVEQHSVFRAEAAKTKDGSAVQRYTRLFCQPSLPEETARTQEVARRDAAFSTLHKETNATGWPNESLFANTETSTSLKVERLFRSELVSRELLRVTGVLPITAQPTLLAAPNKHPAAEPEWRPEASLVLQSFAAMSLREGEASCVWAWMGVTPAVARHVWQQGSVAALRSAGGLTQGTIGEGLYLTLQAHYAALYAMGRLGYREVSASTMGYTLLLCRVELGRVYPVTRQADYTGASKHPGPGARCDTWAQPLRAGFDAHVGLVSEDDFWQVSEEPERGEIAELVVSDPGRITPTAVVFFRLAPQYNR